VTDFLKRIYRGAKVMSNEDTNELNSKFWDELCGTNIAKV
jgi:hypothetical protein